MSTYTEVTHFHKQSGFMAHPVYNDSLFRPNFGAMFDHSVCSVVIVDTRLKHDR